MRPIKLASLFIASSLCLHGALNAASPARARIVSAVDVESKEGDNIQNVGGGKRLILFGTDPATFRFSGRMGEKSSSSIGYYWTFSGGIPERVPEQGVSERADSGPIKFSSAGTAQLHVVDREHPETDMAKDIVWMCYADLKHFGEDCVSYVPEGTTFDRNGKLEARSDWTFHTAPPLKNWYLGRLASTNPKNETIIPPYAITDDEGCVHFTVSRKDSDADWGEIELKETPSKQDPEQIRRLAEKNRAIISEDQPEPMQINIAVEPVTFYKVGLSEDRGAIEAIPTFRMKFPDGQREKLFGLRDPENSAMQGWIREPKLKHGQRKVFYHLPEPVVTALTGLPQEGMDSLGSYMWYHERDCWKAEDGDYYIQIPKTQRTIDAVAVGGASIDAVTFLPRNGLIIALSRKLLVAINVDTGKKVWELPLSDTGNIDYDRLMWINDDLLLGTIYARRCSSYGIISISQKKVIKEGYKEGGTKFFVSGNELVTPDDSKKGGVEKLFVFPNPQLSAR